MKRIIISFFCFLIILSVSSCVKQKSILDRGIYEDMTAAEVSELTQSIPTFQFFYDNIRAKIVAKSDGHDRGQYGAVTYNDMYNLFNYLSSSDYLNFIEFGRTAYSEKMSAYQAQIDSVSEHFRSIIDSVKVKGGPQFDFAKIFKHPEFYGLYYLAQNFPRGITEVVFLLPIKNQSLFSEIGIKDLDFDIILFEKGKPDGGPKVRLDNFKMKLYGDDWVSGLGSYGQRRLNGINTTLSASAVFMEHYDPQKTPNKNFEDIFDWWYEPYMSSVQFLKYVENKIPPAVYGYWKTQELVDISMYIYARNRMINEYVDEYYTPINNYLPELIERHLLDIYHDEYILYQRVNKINPKLTEEFDAMIGRITVDLSEWLPAGLQLPISHPNGNYIIDAEYDKRIFREGSGPEYL